MDRTLLAAFTAFLAAMAADAEGEALRLPARPQAGSPEPSPRPLVPVCY
ncbi:MAG TPA: hypothetical protein VFO11_12190 [Candidatus Polarisedimenticolaceae bacterium]|nr:hypothetical protein [Candidatus Polarisedimenticolaceae bacterium]